MDNNAGLAFLFFVFIIIIIWFFSMSGSVRERNIIYKEGLSGPLRYSLLDKKNLLKEETVPEFIFKTAKNNLDQPKRIDHVRKKLARIFTQYKQL